ncbi:MAG: hypothetical protein KTR31_07425 [Myxococcales bacterium]|nr:hypothetical protein [Myxococcales bacterium]
MRATIGALPLLVISACGGPGEAVVGTRANDPITEPTLFPDATETKAVQGEAFFALYERVVEEVSNPNPLDDTVVDSETHAIKRLKWTPGEPTYVEQLCHTWGNEVFGTTWSFAEDFAEKRGLLQRPVGGSSTGLQAGPYVDLLGTDVQSGALPEEPGDPGVVDTDQDGNPGVTVFVTNDPLGSGEVYLAQRSQTQLSGTWVEDGVGTGSIDTEVESSRLGVSEWWLGIPAPAGTPSPEKSFFVLMEVDAAMDCQAIFEARNEMGLTERL